MGPPSKVADGLERMSPVGQEVDHGDAGDDGPPLEYPMVQDPVL